MICLYNGKENKMPKKSVSTKNNNSSSKKTPKKKKATNNLQSTSKKVEEKKLPSNAFSVLTFAFSLLLLVL